MNFALYCGWCRALVRALDVVVRRIRTHALHARLMVAISQLGVGQGEARCGQGVAELSVKVWVRCATTGLGLARG